MLFRVRRGFTLFDLIVILAILGLLIGLLLPLVQLMRLQAVRTQSINNLKQLGLAAHNYHDVYQRFPSGNDKNNFSAHAHLLPYFEQDTLFRNINLKEASDAKANAVVRETRVQVLVSPLDPAVPTVKGGVSSYLFNAGSLYALADNNGVCYQDSQIRITSITDGTSNTLLTGETLIGTRTPQPDVARQQVNLNKDDLKNLKDEAGVQEFKEGVKLGHDRGHAWIDGRFLQGTFTGTRMANDSKPDVNCAGLGGLSGLRSLKSEVIAGFCDGSVRTLSTRLTLQTWQLLSQRNDGQPVQID